MATSTTTRLKNRARETADEISDTAERGYNAAKRGGRDVLICKAD